MVNITLEKNIKITKKKYSMAIKNSFGYRYFKIKIIFLNYYTLKEYD